MISLLLATTRLDFFQLNLFHIEAELQEFLHLVAAEASRLLETVIKQCDFNKLGALQLDKEVRQFNNYLTTIADWSIRQHCSRLNTLVSDIIN